MNEASHNNFSFEPYSPHFLVRATSSSFWLFCVEKFPILENKTIFLNLATLGHKIWMNLSIAMIISCWNLQTQKNDVKLYVGKI